MGEFWRRKRDWICWKRVGVRGWSGVVMSSYVEGGGFEVVVGVVTLLG
jgi:hypothetical protein